MDINYISVLFTLMFFFIKILLVFRVALYFQVRDCKCTFITAWGLIYILEIFMMSFLSLCGVLSTWPLRLLFMIGVVAVILFLHFSDMKNNMIIRKKILELKRSLYDNELESIICGCVIFILCIYVIRSFIYFDTTADALTYELPRIFQFATQGSIFINQNAVAINIYVDEWIGELNAVFYRVLSGDNISIMFGNIEILIMGFISFRELGKEWNSKNGYLWALSILSLPVTVFLAFTTKSELFAIIGLPLFIFSTFLFWKEWRVGRKDWGLFMGVIVMGALTSGARITTIPAIGMIMIIVLLHLLIEKITVKEWICIISFICVCYLIAWERYILNFIYYGNPFERVDVPNEKVEPSIERFCETAKAYIIDLWNGHNIFTIDSGTVWALNKNAGLIGGLVLIGLLVALLCGIKFLAYNKVALVEYYKEIIATICLVVSFFFLLASLEYYPWSFRYFAPFFCCFILFELLFLGKINKKIIILDRVVVILLVVNMMSTVGLSVRCGEVTGADFSSMLQKSEVERRFAFHPYILTESGNGYFDEAYQYIRNESNILVYTGINEFSSHLYGDNASNNITYCNESDFQTLLEQKVWDAVVISHAFPEAIKYMDEKENYLRKLDSDILGITYLNNKYH